MRATNEPFARGDCSAWADFPDDFEFVASPELPDAGTYRGEAAVRWMTTWVESFDGRTIEATEITEGGDARCSLQTSNGAAPAEAKPWWRAVGGS